MLAAVFEVLFFFLWETVFYTVFYFTGAVLIRVFTLWKVRFPLWGGKILNEKKHEIDHLWLSILVGILFYVLLAVVLL